MTHEPNVPCTFVNKTLLKHRHAHSPTCDLQLLFATVVVWSYRDRHTPHELQSLNHLVHCRRSSPTTPGQGRPPHSVTWLPNLSGLTRWFLSHSQVWCPTHLQACCSQERHEEGWGSAITTQSVPRVEEEHVGPSPTLHTLAAAGKHPSSSLTKHSPTSTQRDLGAQPARHLGRNKEQVLVSTKQTSVLQ